MPAAAHDDIQNPIGIYIMALRIDILLIVRAWNRAAVLPSRGIMGL